MACRTGTQSLFSLLQIRLRRSRVKWSWRPMDSDTLDQLSGAIGPTNADALRQFRRAIDGAFPGRLWTLVLFGSHARGDHKAGSDWDGRLRRGLRPRPRKPPPELDRGALPRRGLRHPIGLPADR